MLQEKYSIFGNVMNLTKDLLSFGKSALNVIDLLPHFYVS